MNNDDNFELPKPKENLQPQETIPDTETEPEIKPIERLEIFPEDLNGNFQTNSQDKNSGLVLEKKLIVEKSNHQAKKKNNYFVSIIVFLLIIGTICASVYYLVSQDIINIPAIKNIINPTTTKKANLITYGTYSNIQSEGLQNALILKETNTFIAKLYYDNMPIDLAGSFTYSESDKKIVFKLSDDSVLNGLYKSNSIVLTYKDIDYELIYSD